MGEQELGRALETLDTTEVFLGAILCSVCLSFRVLGLQRQQLLTGEAPSPFPLQHLSSALVIGALGCFLSLALEQLRTADQAGLPSARINALASLLALGAALLRLADLCRIGAGAAEGEELPVF